MSDRSSDWIDWSSNLIAFLSLLFFFSNKHLDNIVSFSVRSIMLFCQHAYDFLKICQFTRVWLQT